MNTKLLPAGEYFNTVKREYLPFFVDLFMRGYRDPTNFRNEIGKKFCLKQLVFVDDVWHYSVSEINRAGEIASNDWSTRSGLNKAKKSFEKKEKNIQKGLTKDFPHFCDALQAYMSAVTLVYSCDMPVETEMKKLLKEAIGGPKGLELFSSLNSPLKDNYYKKEEYELATKKDIKKHAKKFEWITSRYGHRTPYTSLDAEKKLVQLNKESYVKDYHTKKAKLKKEIALAKKILGKKRQLVDLMQFIIYYRTHRTDVINRAIYYYIPKLETLAKEKGVTYQQLVHCTREEIEGNLPTKQELNERIRHYALVMINGNIRYESGKESREISKYFEEKPKEGQELFGQIACGGMAAGIARIVKNRDDYAGFGKGEILVTTMTTPDMIPIMKRAAAFVTDEGGITCHAAIIARELKKPCIIGTRHATSAIKDGQKVTVDATTGTVHLH